MALELVDGVDLRSLLASHHGRLPPEWVVLIALDLCYALEHAHQPAQAVVHRDISPSNVLISRTGEVKLADFGIAKSMGTSAATVSNTLKGKIPYMSPEHMRGERIDGRADLFSLGVVLFETASGGRPFDGAHDVETMQKILAGDRRDLASLAPELPESLRQVIQKLIELDPDARFADATVLIEELAEMAAPPQARRRLAAHVESLRGGPETRTHVQARREDRDTELATSMPPAEASTDDVGTAAQEATTETAPSPSVPSSSIGGRGRRMGLVAAGLVLAVALVAVVVGLQVPAPSPAPSNENRGSPVRTEVDASRATGAMEPAATTPPEKTADQGVSADEPRERKAAASTRVVQRRPKESLAAKGLLQIVVEPWGNVWIDDKWMGRAPLERWVKPGRHVVQAGHDTPMSTRTIEVSPGAKSRVEMSLEP